MAKLRASVLITIYHKPASSTFLERPTLASRVPLFSHFPTNGKWPSENRGTRDAKWPSENRGTRDANVGRSKNVDEADLW